MAWALVDTRMVGCILGCSSAARHMARSLPIRTALRRVVCHTKVGEWMVRLLDETHFYGVFFIVSARIVLLFHKTCNQLD
jgi:hypothetical protein